MNHAKTLDDMIDSLHRAAEMFESMRRDGVFREGTLLVCTDPNIAQKYDMVEEIEFWQADESSGTTGSD